MVVSIKIQGANAVRKRLKRINKQSKIAIGAAITKAGFFIEGEVKESIAGRKAEVRSVDTGRFLNSINTNIIPPFIAKIETNVLYANKLEFGTDRMAERRHFRNSAQRNKARVSAFISAAVGTATR